MGNTDERLEVKTVKHRALSLRIALESYIDKITFVYTKPAAIGFDFDSSNTHGLIAALSLNFKFGLDNKSEIPGHLATKLATGISFREVDSTSSLHFEISKYSANVHIDSISVALGRDEHGYVIYDTANLLQHLITDHLNRPNIIGPNNKDGFVIGWRF